MLNRLTFFEYINKIYCVKGVKIMIHTITFSPSIDYIMEVDKVNIGQMNRSKSERIYAGGKGINVSIMLRNLDCDSIAYGFIGGFTGEYIKNFLSFRNVVTDFVEIDANSRINIKLKGESETSINANGSNIPMAKINELMEKMLNVNSGDYVVVSGNVPATLPPYIYELLLSNIREPNVNVVLDCEKLLLKNTLKYHPFLIKPNIHELEEYFGAKVTYAEIKEKCEVLQKEGARNIIVSLGGKGAYMLTEIGEEIMIKAPKIALKSSVGSGDCLIAGFLYKYIETGDFKQSLEYGVACGSASASVDYLANKQDVEELIEKMNQ